MYTGQFEYDGEIYQAEHEPLVDRETFASVQALLDNKGGSCKPRPGAQKYKYLLSGMVVCSCGNRMSSYSATSRGNRFFYYKCTNPCCKNAVSASVLDDAVLSRIKTAALDIKLLKGVFDEYDDNHKREQELKNPAILAT